jgi:hypothetical protein
LCVRSLRWHAQSAVSCQVWVGARGKVKQQGLRFALFIFDKLTSTRRVRVSGLLVAFTQITHSQRAIGVMSFHTS